MITNNLLFILIILNAFIKNFNNIKYNLKIYFTLVLNVLSNFIILKDNMIKNIRNILLNFMMSGRFFGDDGKISKQNGQSGKLQKITGNILESKNDYISEVSGFLKDGVKQMKKDLSLE